MLLSVLLGWRGSWADLYHGLSCCVPPFQESQAIPLVSVASVTSGGNAHKAVRRQLSNLSEEERAERLERQGASQEEGEW